MQTEGFMVTFKNCLNFKKRIYFNFWGSNLIMKMKKIISLCIFFTVISTAFAEKKSFDVKEIFTTFGGTVQSKDIIVNGGIGIDSTVIGDISYYIPLMGVSAEYTLQCGPCPLGFGLFTNYAGSKESSFYTDSLTGKAGNRIIEYNNNIAIGALVNYHFNLPVKHLDVYAGPRAGVKLNIIASSDRHADARTGKIVTDKDTELKTSLYIGGTLGASWYFTEKIGANIEAGYPVFAKISASVKF